MKILFSDLYFSNMIMFRSKIIYDVLFHEVSDFQFHIIYICSR